MPRTVVVDEGLRDQISKVIVRGGFEIGGLIGRQILPETRDLVLYMAPFPPDPEAPTPPKSVEQASKEWILDQLSSMERTLVGGITVCGVYVVSGDSNAKKVLETLQRSVEVYAKKLDRPLNFLHVSTQSSQYTCRVRTPEAKGELAAVELKYQALADKLSLYHSLVHLHMALPPPAVDKVDEVAREKAFFSSAIAAVKKEAALIEQGIATLGGSRPLPGSGSSIQGIRVNFYSEISPGEAQYNSSMLSTVQSPQGSTHLVGTVSVLALVHEKEPQEEAIKALQSDLLLSLQERVLVLRDEAMKEREDAEDEGSSPFLCRPLHQGGQLALPRRVVICEDRTKLLFCDYLLVDEEDNDGLQRLSQTLSLPDTQTLLSVESPAPVVVGKASSASIKSSHPPPRPTSSTTGQGGGDVMNKPVSSSFIPLVMLGGGVLIVILAIVISLSQK